MNLFAYRATDPKELAAAAEPVGPFNDEFILAECRPGATVVLAWGAHGKLNGRAAKVTDMIAGAGARMRCLGTTGKGEPSHPLRLAAATPLIDYPAPGADAAA